MDKCIFFKKGIMKIYSRRKLLGRLYLLDLDQPASYISSFYIKEKYRNQGNGNFLIETAIELSKQKGCKACSLHCSISNEGALRFYKRHGFVITATTVKPQLSQETGIVERNYLLSKIF